LRLLDSLILTAVGECFGAPHRIRPPAGGSSAPRTSARMLFRPLVGLPRPSEVLLGLTVGRGGDGGDLYSRRLLSAWSSVRRCSMTGLAPGRSRVVKFPKKTQSFAASSRFPQHVDWRSSYAASLVMRGVYSTASRQGTQFKNARAKTQVGAWGNRIRY